MSGVRVSLKSGCLKDLHLLILKNVALSTGGSVGSGSVVVVDVHVLVDVLVGVVVDVYPKGILFTASTRRPSGSKKLSVILLFIVEGSIIDQN